MKQFTFKKHQKGSTIKRYTPEEYSKSLMGLGYSYASPEWIKRNPTKAQELIEKNFDAGALTTTTLYPEVTVEDKFIPSKVRINKTDPTRTILSTKEGAKAAYDGRKQGEAFFNLAADLTPGIGDVKAIKELWDEYKSTGKVNTLLAASVLPIVGSAGDVAKVFKPVIKDYKSATEMFVDILQQAEKQGIKVDRNSKLYKQIQDEIPGAREYYSDFNKPKTSREKINLAVIPNQVRTSQSNKVFKENFNQEYNTPSNLGYSDLTNISATWFNKQNNQQDIDKIFNYLNTKNNLGYDSNALTTKQKADVIAGIGSKLPKDNIDYFLSLKEGAVSQLPENKALSLLAKEKLKSMGLKGDENFVLSPDVSNRILNNKTNKLTDEQIADGLYLSTKTEQAQKGLMDSKLKDRLMYHATDFDFDAFRPKKDLIEEGKVASLFNEEGFFTSPIKSNIRHYGNKIKALLLSTKNPAIYPKGTTTPQGLKMIGDNLDERIVDFLKENKYDSFGVGTLDNIDEFASFDPTQLKSLFREHLGKWDWNNPNIHRAVGAGTMLGVGTTLNREEKKQGGKFHFKKGGTVKADMKCGQVARSWREGKKIVKKYCIDGKEKLVHAGAKGYTHEGKPSKSDTTAQKKKRANFKARHNCKEAKPGTAKHLACTELWENGGKFHFKKGGKTNNKICAEGVAWAKKKYDKWPSAYASMGASKKCKELGKI
jgi:hypothetical protein